MPYTFKFTFMALEPVSVIHKIEVEIPPSHDKKGYIQPVTVRTTKEFKGKTVKIHSIVEDGYWFRVFVLDEDGILHETESYNARYVIRKQTEVAL